MQAPWAGLLLRGEKTIETREYPLPEAYLGVPLAVLQSPEGGLKFECGSRATAQALYVGSVVFSSQKRYGSRGEWEADGALHRVSCGGESPFGWQEGGEKWGWVVSHCEPAGEAGQLAVLLEPASRIFRSLFKMPWCY